MKIAKTITLLTLLFFLGKTNVFSQTFIITSSENSSKDFNKQIALYTNVKHRGVIITLIKPNGEVIEDFKTTTYYEGANTQDEIDARTRAIVDSKLAIIAFDKDKKHLELTIGIVTNEAEFLKPSSSSIYDYNITKAGLTDLNINLSIYGRD